MTGRTNSQSGQAVMEYIMMLLIVGILYGVIVQSLPRLGIAEKIQQPLKVDFARAYQLGDPTAIPPGEPGGPFKHPRISRGVKEGNFRIFYTKGAP